MLGTAASRSTSAVSARDARRGTYSLMASAVASAIGSATTSATTAMIAEPTSGPRKPNDGFGLRGAHDTDVMSRSPWCRHAGPDCESRK